MRARFLGLDLAWVSRNPSGLAALDESGRLLHVSADLRSDDEILAWIHTWLGDATAGAIAIDMPTIVTQPTGRRDCEIALSREYAGREAGAYPANLGLPPFRDPLGGRAASLLARLADRVVHTCAIAPHDPRIVAFEAFPHAAAVELFGLCKTLKYKKKRRAWDDVLTAWATYRGHLAALAAADPPLHLGDLLPEQAMRRRYKEFDDKIDAVLCAYIASYVWHHGCPSPDVAVFGDMTGGHIVVPKRSQRIQPPPGG